MDIKEALIKNNNKLYWHDQFIDTVYTAAALILNRIIEDLNETEKQLFFNTMTDEGIAIYKKYLNIETQTGASIEEQRQEIQANWLAARGKKFTLNMVEEVCEAWDRGAVNVAFINGVIRINFLEIYGIPKFFDSIKTTLERIKPAHIPLEFIFLTHSWRDVNTRKWQFFNSNTWDYVKEGDWTNGTDN